MGRDDTVCALPLGSANAFRGTIHRMVPLLCLLILLGERFAFLFGLWGLLARNAGRPLTEAVPPCHFMTFPPPRGGIFLLSLRDISPAPRGNLPWTPGRD